MECFTMEEGSSLWRKYTLLLCTVSTVERTKELYVSLHFIIGVGSPVEIGGCGAILIHVIRQYKYHLL